MRRSIQTLGVLAVVASCVANAACSGDSYPGTPAGGSTASTGGTSTGAMASAGSSPTGAGGTSTGGISASAGFPAITGGTTSSGGTPGAGGNRAGAGSGSGGILAGGSGGTPPAGTGGVGASNSGASSAGTSSTGGAVSGGGAPSGGRGGATSQSGGSGGGSGGAMPSGGAGGRPPVSFAEVEQIVGNNCFGCHVTRRPIFTATGTALYNVLTSTAVKQCGDHKLITPGSAASSALIEMVTDQCNGFLMPTSCSSAPCIVAEDLATVTSWINAGAKGP